MGLKPHGRGEKERMTVKRCPERLKTHLKGQHIIQLKCLLYYVPSFLNVYQSFCRPLYSFLQKVPDTICTIFNAVWEYQALKMELIVPKSFFWNQESNYTMKEWRDLMKDVHKHMEAWLKHLDDHRCLSWSEESKCMWTHGKDSTIW